MKKKSLDELMDIEVTSVTRHPEKLNDTASAIQVITNEEIRRSGATCIPEALRLATNLEVAQIDSHTWAISARGFNNTLANKLLVMIDGRTVYTTLYSGVYWDVQDVLLEDVDRIEVINGPGGTLWGSNAVNGVINIITKAAKDTKGLYLSNSVGTTLHDSTAIRYGGEGQNFQYRAYGQFFERGDTVMANGQGGNDSWSMGQGGFRFDWDKSKTDNLTFQGDIYGGSEAQPNASSLGMSGDNLMAKWSHAVSDTSDLKAQLYYDHTYRDYGPSITDDLDTLDFDFQYHLLAGNRHDIVWGLGYRETMDSFMGNQELAFLPPKVTNNLYSAFFQDEIQLIKDRLKLTLGSKLEHNDYTGFELEPSGRLWLKLSPQQSLWGAVSRAVRTPSLVDRDLYSPATPPYFLGGGPNFVSEDEIAYELGYRIQPSPRLALSVSSFYNSYTNIRSLEEETPPLPYPIQIGNGLEGSTYGAEFTANYKLTDRWQLRAGYTHLRVSLHSQLGSTDTSAGGNESHDPNDQFSLHSSWDLTAKTSLDAMFRYVSAIANEQVPAYDELDLRLAWSPQKNLVLSLVGQNLLHANHAEFGPVMERQYIERSLYGSVTWRF
ncbi:MAG TPA: TonB-dependent receptor [Fimbriimonadaceae bacterium]